jgi:hypothetical protein
MIARMARRRVAKGWLATWLVGGAFMAVVAVYSIAHLGLSGLAVAGPIVTFWASIPTWWTHVFPGLPIMKMEKPVMPSRESANGGSTGDDYRSGGDGSIQSRSTSSPRPLNQSKSAKRARADNAEYIGSTLADYYANLDDICQIVTDAGLSTAELRAMYWEPAEELWKTAILQAQHEGREYELFRVLWEDAARLPSCKWIRESITEHLKSI